MSITLVHLKHEDHGRNSYESLLRCELSYLHPRGTVKYSSELKVGITVVVATTIFVLGIRFFQNLPLFAATDVYTVEFNNASGLIAGNTVRVNGVSVGSVKDVFYDPMSQKAHVEFHLNGNIKVPEGSQVRVSGFSALGVVKLEVILGPPGGGVIPPGGKLESKESPDIMANLTETAPKLLERADSVLASLNEVLVSANTIIADPSSSIQRSLGSVESIVATLDKTMKRDTESLSSILTNLESMTANVDAMTGENRDSIAVLIGNLNASARQMDRMLASVENMTSNLAELTRKINDGEGTLGLFVNDPGVYENLDSMLFNLNELLRSFNEDPGRFMKEMRLIDVF